MWPPSSHTFHISHIFHIIPYIPHHPTSSHISSHISHIIPYKYPLPAIYSHTPSWIQMWPPSSASSLLSPQNSPGTPDYYGAPHTHHQHQVLHRHIDVSSDNFKQTGCLFYSLCWPPKSILTVGKEVLGWKTICQFLNSLSTFQKSICFWVAFDDSSFLLFKWWMRNSCWGVLGSIIFQIHKISNFSFFISCWPLWWKIPRWYCFPICLFTWATFPISEN